MNSYSRAVLEIRSGNGTSRQRGLRGRVQSAVRAEFSKTDRLMAEMAVLGACFCLAYLLRFGGHIPPAYTHQMWILVLPFAAARILSNVFFGVHKTPWRYASIADAFRLGLAHSALSVVMLLLTVGLPGSWALFRVPGSVLLVELLLSMQAGVALRISRRYFYERQDRTSHVATDEKQRRLLLIGAGILGSTVAKEMASRPGITIVGFLDDDPTKIGSLIASTPVLGPTAILPELVGRGMVDDVLVCIPPTARNTFNRMWALLEHLPIRRHFVPTVAEILDSPETILNSRVEITGNAPKEPAALAVSAPAPARIEGKRVLITGGAGFIGSTLAERLVADNEIIILDRLLSQQPISFTSLLRHPNVRFIEADIMDTKVLEDLAAEANIVVHAAAIVGVGRVCSYPRETLETNFVGTSRLLHALEKSRHLERVVYFSTSEVFGVNSFRVHEDAPTAVGPAAEARWSYAIAKLAGEHLVKSYHRETGMPSVTVRPFNVFGPRRVGAHAIRSFVFNALQGKPLELHGDGSQIRSWCYIEDFCDGLVAMITRTEAIGEDFNIGNPQNTLTVQQLAQKIIDFTGSQSSIVFRDTHIPDIGVRVPSLEKARRLLGYECKYGMDRSLALTIEWYRSHFAELCGTSARELPAVDLRTNGSKFETVALGEVIPVQQVPARA